MEDRKGRRYREAREDVGQRMRDYDRAVALLMEVRDLVEEGWPVQQVIERLLPHVECEKREWEKTLEWLDFMGPAAIIDLSDPRDPLTEKEREEIRTRLEEARSRARELYP